MVDRALRPQTGNLVVAARRGGAELFLALYTQTALRGQRSYVPLAEAEIWGVVSKVVRRVAD